LAHLPRREYIAKLAGPETLQQFFIRLAGDIGRRVPRHRSAGYVESACSARFDHRRRSFALPSSEYQTFSVPSLLPVRRRLPSGEKATALTQLSCAGRVRTSLPVSASQS